MHPLAVLVVAALVACSGNGAGGPAAAPLTIALMTPKSGALSEVGLSFERVAQLAVAEVNAQGGIDGRELALVVVNDESEPMYAEVLFQALADLGVVGVVGPARSGSVTNVVAAAALRHLPLISPSSTQQGLELAEDDGYMFRNVSNDAFQGLAMAHYLADLANPRVLKVVVVAEDSDYGAGLAGSFESAFERPGRGGEVTKTLPFAANLDDAGADAVVAQIVAEAPAMVVMVALEQDALKIVKAWDAGGELPGLTWFFTDGARSMGFLSGLPASVIGSFGTAPTNPDTGEAYGVLVDRYDSGNADHVSDHVYAANVWDAVFLLAAALAQQGHDHPDEAPGGAGLRDAITSVSRVGQIYNAGQWADLVAAIAAGGDVDYDGASGPCNFDSNGEAIGPYEVWQIEEGVGHALFFERKYFLEAGELE